MRRPVALWGAWVDLWREREAPDAYALGRIVWGSAVIGYLLHQAWSPGVLELYALPEHGGVWAYRHAATFSLFDLFAPTPPVVYAVFGAACVAAVALTVGAWTRGAALALMLLQLTLRQRLELFEYGGDSVVSVFSFLMVLAPLGASWSVDAHLRGVRASVPLWPRRLIIAQLTLLYVKTGIVKAGSQWSLAGGYSALYYALNDPSFARVDGAWAARLYPLTQLGTFVARWWETLFFVLPWSMYLRRHPDHGGRLRRALARFDLRLPMLGIGVVLHLGLFATMHLGMFPFVTMALYSFFLRPDEARRVLQRVLGAGLRGRAPVPTRAPGAEPEAVG